MAENAANALQLSPNKALELKVIDEVVPEPLGGAHRYKDEAIEIVKNKIIYHLKELQKKSPDILREERFEKFRQMGNNTLKLS